MFDNRDENGDSYYTEAVKDAVINNTDNKKINNKIFLILNLIIATFLVGGVLFFTYKFFLQKDDEHLIKKTKVMGVTHIAKDNKQEKVVTQSDIDYAIEIEKLDSPTMDNEYNKQLSKYLLNKKRTEEDDTLTDNEEERWRDVTIVVKDGDTLVSLAKKYYNDPKAYDKIIKSNPELTENSHTIYPGQKLKIPTRY